MNCPDCTHDNRSGIKYCTRCGSPLYLICPACRSAVQEDDIFCGECGVKLPQMVSRPQLQTADAAQQQTSPETEIVTTPGDAGSNGIESARKHVTVLFADISGFTAMSEKLDPEEVTDLMNGCLKRLAETVTKYEGYVDKFVGDCIMALFGAPIAHENDPELAVRCALEMNQVTAEYNKILPIKLEKPLMLHTGVNSGMVVAGGVGSDANMSYTVMGDTVNLASRLESIAGNGQIFLSKYTYNLVRNKFAFKEHEPIKVKGKKDPVAVYEVTGVKTSRTQERSDQKVKTPLIGRSQEMKTLHSRIDRFLEGDSQIVLLTSDAGIGKSRVQQEIESYLADKQVQIIQGTCHSFSRSTSYYRLDRPGRSRVPHHDIDTGIPFAVLAQHGRQPVAAGRIRSTQYQASLLHMVEIRQFLLGLLHQFFNLGNIPLQHLTGLRKRQIFGGAVEQPFPQRVL